ncbi:sporulation and spore germination protein [Desulfobotulus alkaliphilus]|uniref:Sporulation and spore germination protein n=1 Tax=Desulfobotulus alkaliphilus TaxID=622671 RepID=A0A562RVR3_9BACT|nr:GerMN domain-containing protein [Desulfobotulus alkaliphilus]TWI73185.1 sporulation and spore germination protein [Desulfobotulus alkaliphilus]
MKLPPIPVFIIGALLIALAFWAGMRLSGNGMLYPPDIHTMLPEDKRPHTREKVYLYFAHPASDTLSAETRNISLTGTPQDKARSILDALITGPSGEGNSPLPEGTRILAVYIENNMAVLDFHPDIRNNHPGGSLGELMTIYALVNSLVINVPEIRKVKILIAGQEQDTLAGHIDIRHPLTANMMIVR